MTAQQAMAFVRQVFPKAKTYRQRKGRWLVYTGADFGQPFTLGTFGGYCRQERAWKRAALQLKKGK